METALTDAPGQPKATPARKRETAEPHALASPPQAGQTFPAPTKPLPANAAALQQFVNNTWTVVAPDNLTAQNFEDPSLWLHAGRQFSARDLVYVVQSNCWTMCLVTEKTATHARLTVLLSCPVKPPEAVLSTGLPDGYEIRPVPLSEIGLTLAKYAVIRLSDGVQLNKNQHADTYEEARAWLLSLTIFRAPPVRVR